jgi:hypothetical protein
VILGLRKGAPDVDHRNRDRLDNRRGNLRSATDSQNGANKSKSTTRSHSKFKGVTFHRNTGRWQAAIKHHDRCIYLGLFDAEENAARAYDHAALRIFGEFARPNFPEDARP